MMADWRSGSGRGGRALIIGAGLTALWLLMLLIFWLTSGSGSGAPGWISAVAALMPLGLIWLAVGLARAIDILKAEAADLRADLEHGAIMRADPMAGRNQGEQAARQSYQPAMTAAAPAPRVQPPRPAPAARRADDRAQAAAADPRQTSLGFDDTPDPIDLPAITVIRALNFPDGPDDREAVAALRDTLRDPDHARLIRSAQDVITLLADRGIYTDELEAGPADVGAWRRFAEGQRGSAVSGMGAVRNPEMLDAAIDEMRHDDVFRDAVHHFLRLFDRSVTALMPQMGDDEIAWLAQTRSALAFMLLARAAGLFGQAD